MSKTAKLRAFLVEDEAILLVELALIMGDLGYEVVETASDVERGLALARELSFDVAVLDVNVAGRNSGPIADELENRGIPFVFASGYTKSFLPERHAHRLLVPKPISATMLREALNNALNSSWESMPAHTPETSSSKGIRQPRWSR